MVNIRFENQVFDQADTCLIKTLFHTAILASVTRGRAWKPHLQQITGAASIGRPVFDSRLFRKGENQIK